MRRYGFCAVRLAVAFTAGVLSGSAAADDWPQWRGPERDGVWREDGIVETLPRELPVRWRTPIGEGYAGPAVAGGRVFVHDRILKEGERNPDNPFQRVPVQGYERVLALDAGTGKVLWKHEYPSTYTISYPYGPRATPTVDGDTVYALGAMGDLFALDAAGGEVRWRLNLFRDFHGEVNTWGASAAPLADGPRLIVLAGGGDGSCVVALDKKTGKVIWKALECADPGYSAPIIIRNGGRRELIVWTPYAVNSLDPETGTLYWSVPFEVRSGLSVATPIWRAEDRLLFVTAFYNGPLLLELSRERPGAKILWRGTSSSERRTDKLHGLLCTPVFDGDYIYGVCSYGQLRCLEVKSGRRVWETFEATGHGRWWTAFIVRHRDRYFLANEQGDLIIAELSPEGYKEKSRARLIEPTRPVLRRKVVWSHPAFAYRSVFARNDREILRADLAAEPAESAGGD